MFTNLAIDWGPHIVIIRRLSVAMFDYWNGYRHCENMSSRTKRTPQIPKYIGL